MLNNKIPVLDRQGLRKFGLLTAAVVVLLFGVFLPWLLSSNSPLWPWIVSATLILWSLLLPSSLRGVYNVWMKIGMVLGFINTRIILFILYYLIFLPVGLVFKITGRDSMARSLTPTANDSYRVLSQKRDPNHFERPY